MPASRVGLFDSLRRLLRTSLELAEVRLELLVADLELEKLRLVEAALRALIGLMLVGLGLVMVAGFVLLLFWESHRMAALGVLALLCLGGGFALLRAATLRLQQGDGLLAATRAELRRDHAALRD
jgi:uncharacterized membrane protein YqjE